MIANISELISPGERFLWSGRPSQKFGLGWTNIFLLAIVSAFFAGAVNMLYYRLDYIKSDPLALDLALVYVISAIAIYGLAGLLFIIGRDYFRKKNTEYAISNQRAIILINGRRAEIHYINLKLIDQILMEKNGDGTDSVRFLSRVNKNDSSEYGNALDEACFENLEDASLVYEYVKRAAEQQSEPDRYH